MRLLSLLIPVTISVAIFGLLTLEYLRIEAERERCAQVRAPLESDRILYAQIWLNNCTNGGQMPLDLECWSRVTDVLLDRIAFDNVAIAAQGCKP